MKRLIIVASMTLLAACSTTQLPQLNLVPEATISSDPIVQGKSYNLTSKDARAAQYVALVDSGRANILPIHAHQNLRIKLEEAVNKQFASQGFTADVNSDNTILLEIQETLVNVSHSVMENEMDARVVIGVTAATPRGKLVKTYTGTGERSGNLSASDEEITQTLNDVINLTLREIAEDHELKLYMKERF